MKISKYIVFSLAAVALTACQNKDIDIVTPLLDPIPASNLTGQLVGDDYIWEWPSLDGKSMKVQVLNGNILVQEGTTDGTSFTHNNVDTNLPYTYVFKVTDGAHFSSGTVCYFTRPGATKISGIMMRQSENSDGTYDAVITWDEPADAETILLSATSESKKVTENLPGEVTEYVIPNVLDGEEWSVTLTADNETGASLPTSSTLRIGKTAIGYLSIYPTPEELIANGDDDEACAWLWLQEEYPSAQFVYFGDISSKEVLTPYRVLFWMRDLEYNGDELNAMGKSVDDVVFEMPQVVKDATPYVTEWYKDGGSLLLWSHATVYIGDLGRIPTSDLKSNDHSFDVGKGGWNPDNWPVSVELFPGYKFKIDLSGHPVFKGLDVKEVFFDEDNVQGTNKRIFFKGAGWTENHNCLFFNLPAVYTGIGNQEQSCYDESVKTYGIIPLATWDSQWKWISQLNVWEAQQGNTDFKGTIICVGNGGMDFSMRNADGSADISAYPKNNPYQGNILTLAKNALEYLKGR